MPTHYETLGLSQEATPAQIKSAYRRLAREIHPDVSAAPDAKDRFQEVQHSYEVLSDSRRREAYDAILLSRAAKESVAKDTEARKRIKEQLEAEELRRKAEERMRDGPAPATVDPAATAKLTSLLNSGKIVEAERLARQMIANESRQSAPYAVLGDIARFRGEFDQALHLYGTAAQFEPRDPTYQQRYEEMLHAQAMSVPTQSRERTTESSVRALGVAVFLVVAMAVYTVLSPEKPLGLALAPTWTMGLIAMLFLSGIVAGACSTASGAMARFHVATGSAVMRVSPTVVLGVLSLVSFWLATTIYVLVGHVQQAFNRSISCLLTSVGAVTTVFALAGLAHGADSAVQNLAWGGNIVYFGAMIGWYVTDGLRAVSAQKGL